jgi:diguanylate cyclase (GGDEF)-like protein
VRARLIGVGTRAGDRGRRWVVRFPGWLHRGVTTDGDGVRRLSAFALYLLYVPLAFAVELSFDGWARHPWVLGLATTALVMQAAAVWLARPMPLAGWTVLTAAVPTTFVAYGYASPDAGQVLGVMLVAPVAWAAAFLPTRLVALAVTGNVAAVGSLLIDGSTRGAVALFAARALTLVVIGVGVHALVGSLRRAHDAVQLRADTDAATGTFSRSRMLDVLTTAIGGRAAEDPPAGVVLVDIDHFKRVNDAYGHTAGDDALCEVVDVLRAVLRDTDVLARWGGEEFLLFAPDMATPSALARLCEKLRAAVEAHPFTIDGHTVSLTISLGAALAEPALPIRELIAAADDALYLAKRAGRNRVRIAQPRISHLQIDATPTDLARIRGRVREAAAAAGLPDERVQDIALAVSEACAHLLRRDGSRAQHALNVTTHDRDHQFSVTVHDEAPQGFDAFEAPDDPDLDITVMSHLADQVQTESHGRESGLTIIFSKRSLPPPDGDLQALPPPVGQAGEGGTALA